MSHLSAWCRCQITVSLWLLAATLPLLQLQLLLSSSTLENKMKKEHTLPTFTYLWLTLKTALQCIGQLLWAVTCSYNPSRNHCVIFGHFWKIIKATILCTYWSNLDCTKNSRVFWWMRLLAAMLTPSCPITSYVIGWWMVHKELNHWPLQNGISLIYKCDCRYLCCVLSI